ncbi:MAG: ferrochelatase, partial [Alphaproteobacteria bacterium]
VRWLLAQLISRRRAPVARAIYDHLGGGSPLLANTRAQASALQDALHSTPPETSHLSTAPPTAPGVPTSATPGAPTGPTLSDPPTCRVFVCMRYWAPQSDAVAQEVARWQPDRILLVPLYPQFSTTTTGSSFSDWDRAARRAGLQAPTRRVCCWPLDGGWIAALADLLAAGLTEAARQAPGAEPRILFSAHGLPEKIVAGGDPYAWQVEQTAAAIVAGLGQAQPARSLARPLERGRDWQVCYQSRVGPLAWIGPDTEAEIARAGADGRALVVVPVAFVSDHSETLVELDIEYRATAEAAAVPAYVRVPVVATHPTFIAGLAGVVRQALARHTTQPVNQAGGRLCPAGFGRCPCQASVLPSAALPAAPPSGTAPAGGAGAVRPT